MDAAEKHYFISILRNRYRKSEKKKKGEILDEVCESLSLSRKHAMRLMRSFEPGRPRKPFKRGRPSKYQNPEFISALRIVWKSTRYMCSRLLKEAIPSWLPYIEDDRGVFKGEIREKLLSISPPTIDRILKPYKGTKGKSFTRATGFRDEIPIQENIWDVGVPGFVESDTVAHCGGSMHGEFVNTLTIVDIASIWTEALGAFGRGSNAVFEALKQIEGSLPFPILGYDADNGGEVLNKHIVSYFQDERVEQGRPPVQVTRSRPYKKNDNAHVEQRNDSIARRYLGYERIDFKQVLPLINCYYSQIVCPMQNHFFPTFKLKDKLIVKSRTRRIYGKPVTPYERIMTSDDVPDEYKAALSEWHLQLNPVTLVHLEFQVRKQIDFAIKQLKAGNKLSKKALTPPDLTPRPEMSHFQKCQSNNVIVYEVYDPLNHTSNDQLHNFGEHEL